MNGGSIYGSQGQERLCSVIESKLLSMPKAGVVLLAFISMLAGRSVHTASVDSLGKAGLQNSCQPTVQSDFERAVALLQSFEFGESEREFRKMERADSTCVIAAWGVAHATFGTNIAKTQLAMDGRRLNPVTKTGDE
jgi:hypothetical protein